MRTLPWIALVILAIQTVVIVVIIIREEKRELPSYSMVAEGYRILVRGDKEKAEKAFDQAWELRWSNAFAVYALSHVHSLYAKDIRTVQMSDGTYRKERRDADEALHAVTAVGLILLSVPLFILEVSRGAGTIGTMPPSFVMVPWALAVLLFGMSFLESRRTEYGRIPRMWFIFGTASIVAFGFAVIWVAGQFYQLLRHIN